MRAHPHYPLPNRRVAIGDDPDAGLGKAPRKIMAKAQYVPRAGTASDVLTLSPGGFFAVATGAKGHAAAPKDR
jgi:hypothetical protein